MNLSDRQGRTLVLGRELGRGGEGAVFEVASRPGAVAKIYHDRPARQRADKLAAMVERATPRLTSLAAWPTELLLERPQGAVVGFLMERVAGYKDIHLLYGPRTRLREFPAAGWSFLVHTAANLARAFAVVHDEGHVIGDVNDKVALVSEQATVKLVDCDSFQVRHNGLLFPCDVGVPTHQPPEFQQVSTFRGLERSQNHDAFGLAVLIFQLLFMARHPFSGAFLGHGDMSIEQAIREHRFAYGASAAQYQMRPPPHSLGLAAVGSSVGALFERAFGPSGVQGGRPAAREWMAALDALGKSLQACQRNANHALVGGSGACPICAIEARAGVVLFALPLPSSVSRPPPADLAAIWAEIQRVVAPAPAPAPMSHVAGVGPSPLGARAAEARRRRQQQRGALFVVAALALIAAPFTAGISLIVLVVALAFVVAADPERHPVVQEARSNLSRAEQRWGELMRRWESETGTGSFEAKRGELGAKKTELDALEGERRRRLQELESDRVREQRDAFLDQHRLANASIPGIGQGRKVTLESFGIETAKDVESSAIAGVPGFGPALTRKLLDWREGIARKFVFDPSRPVDPRAVAAVERDIDARRARILAALSAGPAQLRAAAQDIDQRRSVLRSAMEDAARAFTQARADLEAR